MKSFGGLFEWITSCENLERAMRLAARGKQDRSPVQRFLGNAEKELVVLREELRARTYRPRPYTQFRICDPKPRTISCADFRDRVVHHAVCDVIGPLLERRMISHSYACREGKGTHRAVLQAERYCRRFRYYLKMDVRKFFESVDHEILLGLLRGLFREPRLGGLLEILVRHPVPHAVAGKGLPIGNLTSQWFANLYLDGLDHTVKEEWQFAGYVRYMDDIVLWAEDKADLWWALASTKNWLETRRRVTLKETATRLAPTKDGLPFLGLRVYPQALRLQRQRYRRLKRLVVRREKELERALISPEQFVGSLRAAAGILSFLGLKGLVSSSVDL
ncbi:MAG: RNA-directed DNA polymerase [Planctomycetes bacterium]|jgi:retron-type reverse transcriptase|nr:RNA-directed DNA polymerase [Planctomycetota bacterium]